MFLYLRYEKNDYLSHRNGDTVMKFQFKIQQYQTDAVESVVRVFDGQNYSDGVSYIRD